ncbi:hypothetical protein EG329_000905 [Mollisiaceae sp. DMI_Dod_QoI]|nr:hypothetical protein EG329_000905 [Helotiales sp. DMI_Dod_QoI]
MEKEELYQTKLKWREGRLALIKRYDPTSYTIEEATRCLGLLNLELPDASQELVEQELHPRRSTFTCFLRLPSELRLAVWKLLLPGRRLTKLVYYGTLWDEDADVEITIVPWELRPRDPKLPVTLFVNQESRQYTQETYHIVFQQMTGHIKIRNGMIVPHERTLCLNPVLDQVCIDMAEIFDRHNCFQQSYDQEPHCFDSVRTLELRDFHWLSFDHTMGGPELVDFFLFDDEWVKAGGILRHFRNLQSLHLIARRDLPHERIVRLAKGARKSMDDLLTTWYTHMMDASEVQEYSGGVRIMNSAPKIFFHNWRRIEARTDEAYLNDARIFEEETE